MLRRTLLFSLAFCFASSGCARKCTLIGCFDSLTVELRPEVPSTYDVELVLDGVEGAFTCTKHEDGFWQVTNRSGEVPMGGCGGADFDIVDETPESVQITVTAQDVAWIGSIDATPSYGAFQPNGRKCPPTCQRASLIVQAE